MSSNPIDIATAIVRVLQEQTFTTLMVYLGPDGAVGYRTCHSTAADDIEPLRLVGTYTSDSTVMQISEDVAATQESFQE